MEIGDHKFRLPYWDWSDESQREILFSKDRLGENVKRVNTKGKMVTEVEGDLFTDWETYCWEDIMGRNITGRNITGRNITGYPFPIPICNPIFSSNENLRRCPREEFCKKSHKFWPNKTDVDTAVSIKSYDASPYDRCIEGETSSFRNYMEGFILEDKCDEDDQKEKLCSEKEGKFFTRKLHNTVSNTYIDF